MDTEPGKTKFDIKREATYQALLEAGLQAFAERGYAGAWVDDIARRIGQTKGAFYFHFRSKLDLLRHLVADREQRRAGWQHLLEEFDPALALVEVVAATLAEVDRRMGGASGSSPSARATRS